MQIIMKEKIKGLLIPLMIGEAARWGIQPTEFPFPQNYVELCEGDRFTVFRRGTNDVIWNGVIDPDYGMLLTTSRYDIVQSKPCVGGLWVEWLQYGTEPTMWSNLFHEYNYGVIEREI